MNAKEKIYTYIFNIIYVKERINTQCNKCEIKNIY